MQEQEKEVLEVPLEKHSRKNITTVIIALILFAILIFIGFSFYLYFKSPEHKLNLGANIEEAKISEDGKIAYIKLAGGINYGNITKINFIFTDAEDKEYTYETSEGASEISVPFKRSFWQWLFGKQAYEGKYDYEINASDLELNNFNNINEVSVSFEYKTERGEETETPVLDTTKTTTTPVPTTTTGGGGPSGPSPCTPNKDCSYYYNLGQCGSGLNDGCSAILDCLTCPGGKVCVNESCVELIECTDNENCSYLDNVCVIGVCNASNKCEVAYNVSGTICNDGLFCTINDVCDGAGNCQGTVKDCSDTIACTDDNCNKINDKCDNIINNSKCNYPQETCNETQGCITNLCIGLTSCSDYTDTFNCTNNPCSISGGCEWNITGKCEQAAIPKTSQLSQYNITWTFDKEYEYGQFANGDYWVVGPVNITNITPGWDGNTSGSMVNPDPGNRDAKGEYVYQAFDRRVGSFKFSLLVQAPVTLNPNSSLVSVISWIVGEPGSPGLVHGIPRPALKTAAVLTVLNSIPPDNGATIFRPPYAGNNKPLYSTSSLRKDLLPNLPLVSSTLNITGVANRFKRVWLDLGYHGDLEQYMCPSYNMPSYGRDISILVGDAALLLMLNEQELINQFGSNKDTLLIRFAQVGIDNYGVAENGGTWWGGGGLNSGRKWPILFTGLMLNHSGMKDIGITSPTMKYEGFAEDCQTFYVDHIYNDYNNDDVGLPEWGGEHCHNLRYDYKNWSTSYRGCCTAKSWAGFVLAAHIMNAKELWNHDALFDYQDRYMEIQKFLGSTARSASKFAEDMWDTYRANYSCIWTRDNQSDIYSKGHYDCSSCLYNCLSSPYCGDGSCNGNETTESCEWDCSSLVPSFSPFTKLWNFLKGLLTRETGNAILTGKAITGNAVNETNNLEKSGNFITKIIELFKKLFGF